MKKLIILIIFWIFFAPSPPGIALNHGTKECGDYRGGDEFGTYILPAEWEIYYPRNDGLIQTEIGSCQWSGNRATENCCQQLGYTYVPGNIGEERGRLEWSPGILVSTG